MAARGLATGAAVRVDANLPRGLIGVPGIISHWGWRATIPAGVRFVELPAWVEGGGI